MRAYPREAAVALSAVRSASRAALSLQKNIAATKAAYQKEDATATIGGSVFSPVTAGDFMVQVLVVSALASAFPNDRFIAEETGAELLAAGTATRSAVMDAVAKHSPMPLDEADALAMLNLGRSGLEDGWSSSGRTWVLDPIDGTKGFLRGDQFAVALSLLDGGQPVLGLLGCPNLGDGGALFWTERGHGACWGATHGAASAVFDAAEASASASDADALFAACAPLRVSDPGAGGLVRCEAFEAAHTNWAVAAAIGERLGVTAEPVRMDGQGKYGLLARGDAHVFTRLPRPGYREKIWDVAAGALLVAEAGGRVTDTRGRPLDFSRGETLDADVAGIVASNGHVHDALLEALDAAL